MKTYKIENQYHEVTFVSRGASVISFKSKKDGLNIVCAYQNLNDYIQNPKFLGTMVGPLAGRTKDGLINTQQLTINNGSNHLHGGDNGVHSLDFDVEQTANTSIVFFKKNVSHERDGYKGTYDYRFTYQLLHDSLILDIFCRPSHQQPLNLTNHMYFNLENSQDLNTHSLKVNANLLNLVDETMCNRGRILDTAATIFDLNYPRNIGEILKSFDDQFLVTKHLDHNFHLSNGREVELKCGTKTLIVKSTYPCVQIYLGNYLEGFVDDQGRSSNDYQAVAIEPQYAPNHYNYEYEYVTYGPNKPFHETIVYTLFNNKGTE